MNTVTSEQVIVGLFDDMADAWNRGDSAAFGQLFSHDADFVEIRGGHHVGRSEIVDGHQALWDSIYAGSTVEYRVEAVRSLGDGYAVGVIGATMRAPSGPVAGTIHARITAVVSENDERGRIISYHNTLVQGDRPAA